MKVEDEKQAINKVDNEIAAMEQEEKEILQRLKNSQKMEQDAYQSLEKAIKTSVEGTEWRKQMMNSKQRLPIKKNNKKKKTQSNASSVYERSVR